MPNPYTGTPEGDIWAEEDRRKALRNALMKQAMGGIGDNQMAGRFMVKRSPFEAIGKIAQGAMASGMNDSSEERLRGAGEDFETNKQQAIDAVTQAMMGSPALPEQQGMHEIPQGQHGPQVIAQEAQPAVAPDYLKAATMAGTDPYLANSGVGKVALAKMAQQGKLDLASQKANAGGANFKPWTSIHDVSFTGQDGKVVTMPVPFNNRTGVWDYSNLPNLAGQVNIPTPPNKDGSPTPAVIAPSAQPAAGPGTSPKYSPTVKEDLSRAGETGKQDVLVETEPVKQRRIMEEKHQASIINNRPKIESSIKSLFKKQELLDTTIDEAIAMADYTTAGPAALLDFIPGTPMKELKTKLETIKAKVGFDELGEMRKNSPTGGALGQVSELENKLLQAVQGSIDNLNNPSELKSNLADIKRIRNELNQHVLSAYKTNYKTDFVFDEPVDTVIPENGAVLPEGVTEDDIIETMKVHNMTRDQVLEALK